MDNLLSGAIGGLIGTFLSSMLSLYLFSSQTRIDSNRIFLSSLIGKIQEIYLALEHGLAVNDDDIKILNSFQVIGLKEFKKLNVKLTEVRTNLISYNSGVSQSMQSTSTTVLQVSAKTDSIKKINELIELIRKMT
jgi:hypothetical protein